VRWAPERIEPAATDIHLVVVQLPRGDVIDIAWIAARETTRPDGEGIGHRHIDGAAHPVSGFAMLNVAAQHLHAATELCGGGLCGYKLEQPPEAAGAVKGSLRTAQHFDTHEVARIDIRITQLAAPCVGA